MARRQGFKRNAKTVARILHTHDGGKRAAAQRIFDRLPENVKERAFIKVYHTDREVVAVYVPADEQAKNGVGTRAAQAEAASG